MKKVYGLTGGIASGKSAVSRMLQARGATVIDADLLAREVVEPGTPGLQAIRERFGEGVLKDGLLDRGALGAMVFEDAEARQALNAILHPLIAAKSAERIGEALSGPGDPIFYDAALLVENGLHRNFAALVVVACSQDTQVARIVARDGLSEAEAHQRIASQLPLSDKVQAADHVLWNEGTLGDLEHAVEELLHTLRS